MKMLLMSATRKSGAAEFQFRIFGYPGNQFPPISIQTTMHEMAGWLRHLPRRPAQRVVLEESASHSRQH